MLFRSLLDAGIPEIYLVTGHRAEQFTYLEDLFPIHLVHNADYRERNNNGSIYAVRDVLQNSYICSADNYFVHNPFEPEAEASYYAAVYAEGQTPEWCLVLDEEEYIQGVTIGGQNSWYMYGHTFWDEDFSRRFVTILDEVYEKAETRPLLWESIFLQNLDTLKMKVRKYPANFIYEFDTVEELKAFDPTFTVR